MNNVATQIVSYLIAASLLTLPMETPAAAKNSNSLGHGVKCTWVLVSSVNNTNTYKQVCRKGV